MKIDKQKLVIVFTVFVDVIGIGVIIPILPFYVESFGASPLTVSLLFGVYSFFSFFSSPLLGSLSDRIGRRPILMLSIFSSAIGWLVFANAKSILFLFIGRIIDGFAAGNFSTAQSYLSDIAKNDKERTANLGLVGAIFGVGFILGPMLGGFLGSISKTLPFWFVGVAALLNALSVMVFLPETLKDKRQEKISFNPFLPIKKALTDKKLHANYTAWFLFGLAASGMQSVFSLYLEQVFGFGSSVIGLFLAGMGVVMVVNQGIGLKHFWLRYFSEPKLELDMLLVCGVGFLLLSFNNLMIMILGLLVMVTTQSILRAVMTSRAAGGAGVQERGEVLGILSSLSSVGAIVGPLAAGSIFMAHHRLPFVLSTLCMWLAFGVIWGSRRRLAPIKPVAESRIDSLS